MSDEPDDLFQRHAAAKARWHGRLLVALGVVTEREPDEPRDGGERGEPKAPAA